MQYIKNLIRDISEFLLKTVSDFESFGLSCSSREAVPELGPLKDGDFFFLIIIPNLFADNCYPLVHRPALALSLSSI